MNRIIMIFFAAAAVLGGLDCIAGNKKGYGERFEEAFRLLGPTALSMAGMICISPALSFLLERLLAPLLRLLGTDPALAGGFFAIDMGGYQLAMQLADSPDWGGFFGILVGAVFGCTLTFTLPVGIGVIEEADSGFFLKGVILGLITMPAGFLAGGLLFGFAPGLLLRRLAVLLVGALLLSAILLLTAGEPAWLALRYAQTLQSSAAALLGIALLGSLLLEDLLRKLP